MNQKKHLLHLKMASIKWLLILRQQL
jgi:hypothetical protein